MSGFEILTITFSFIVGLVNGLMAITQIFAYGVSNTRVRAGLYVVLIAMTIYGALTVWTTPNLEMPL